MNEQELILTSVLKCQRVDLYAKDIDMSDSQKQEIQKIKDRRLLGEPVQYILNSSDFMGDPFYVDSNVLIPRPETEILVESILNKIENEKLKNIQILDIGTGSGNIIISLAKRIESANFVAMDISKKALAVAQRNAKHHNVEAKINFISRDILINQECLEWNKKFDIIISNPPYVRSDDIAGLSSEVQNEPRLALDGGDDGLKFYRVIAKKSTNWLSDRGEVFLEIGDGQEKDIESIFCADKSFVLKKSINDYMNMNRILILEKTHA